MPNFVYAKNEWNNAERLVNRKLREANRKHPYSGLIKIDKKESGLNHSFMAVVENGVVKKTFAKARKKALHVEGVLGNGSFAVTALAETRDGKQYAMKIQGGKNKDATEPEFIRREMHFLRILNELEAEGQRQLEQGSGKHYAFMKLKHGIDLQKVFLTLPAPIDLTDRKIQLILAIKCLQGIEFLHSMNIVHRDIKPSNIMVKVGLGEKSDIMIVSPTDYGESHALNLGQNVQHNVAASGTKPYMAPEVTQEILSKANDIYSLGVMFHKDFHIQDRFVARMLSENPNKRPDVSECIQYFQKKLKDHLRVGKNERDVKKELARLLADEQTLLRELAGEVGSHTPERRSLEHAAERLGKAAEQFNSKGVEKAAHAGIIVVEEVINTRPSLLARFRNRLSQLRESFVNLFKRERRPTPVVPARHNKDKSADTIRREAREQAARFRERNKKKL